VLHRVCVHAHLAEVLLMTSLGLRLFSIEVGANLDQSLLRDLGLLLPRSEGLLPLNQLVLYARSFSCRAYIH
jgi:hypothetical protein